MHLVGVDTVKVNYCTPGDECYSTNVYLTFENCDGLSVELNQPEIEQSDVTVEASNDHFEVNSAQETSMDVLANDAGEKVTSGEVYVNIISAPQNGEISYNNTLSDIVYTPSVDFVGDDSFVYEICSNGVCDRAVASINVTADQVSSIEDQNLETNLNIAPNPANDYIYVAYNSTSNQKINIQLFNAFGQLVYSYDDKATNSKYKNIIDVSAFESGIYLLRLIEGKKISTEKIIVQ